MGIAAHRGRARETQKRCLQSGGFVFFLVVVLNRGGSRPDGGNARGGIGRRRNVGTGSFVGWVSLVQKHQLGWYLCENVKAIEVPTPLNGDANVI